jgi:hypothetical protein
MDPRSGCGTSQCIRAKAGNTLYNNNNNSNLLDAISGSHDDEHKELLECCATKSGRY